MLAQERKSRASGFTLVELVIVMAVISLILSVVIPNLRGMQQEGQLTKSEAELDTLKTAVTSYWRNNGNVYPADIQKSLTTASPTIITQLLNDPWKTDASGTYGYSSGTDATFGDYFIIYTKGPKGDTAPAFDAVSQTVKYKGSGRVSSNAPIVKQ
jgi:prepilin-type N-terminal cleavage/methylation domain-containing protein